MKLPHNAVEAIWNSDEKPDNAAELTRKYVSKVTDPKSNLRGNENDYHNLAAECARHCYFDLACEICKAGLNFFPRDVDLLADWVQYGTKIGEIETVKVGPLETLLSIDKAQWNWRAFDYTVDLYLAAEMFGEAEMLANDFVRYLPYEERAYYCQAVICQKRYAKEDAMHKTIGILKKALDMGINCPMCAHKLAEILCDCGRLDEALEAINRAIMELAQEQPSISYGYVIYRRGLILDRMAHKMNADGVAARNIAVKSAIDYQTAIASCCLNVIPAQQASVRLGLLKTYFEIDNSEIGDALLIDNDLHDPVFCSAMKNAESEGGKMGSLC